MPNEEGLYSEEEFKGLLADKQNEVRNRQNAQAELAAAKRELESLNARIKSIEHSPKEENLDNLDDVITRADLIKELKKQKKELTDEYVKDKEELTLKQKEAIIEKSFGKARDKYTEEKAGKGLTFDEVWEGTKRLIENNPGYKAVITGDKNPGEKAYEIGLQDSIIAKRVALDKKNFPDQKRTSKVGLESTEIPAQFFSQERVSKMTSAEIQANLPAIRESQKKWKK
ncbi:hypothetical protein CVT91_00010 [Candidatus Atribacteria bacterium HGW-Atribacteria-1]|nr:MAG: hypothetical protein CVT91_00010 [Candidatus Atribacteria bacterium HGW-Atribacteria-1]